MDIFYDWEFREYKRSVYPISLGMYNADEGSGLYLINKDFPNDLWSDWLNENVKPFYKQEAQGNVINLELEHDMLGEVIYDWLLSFKASDKWRLIGYYSQYDHVCLSQCFGAMVNLPEKMPKFSYDLKQWVMDLDNPKIMLNRYMQHHAFHDALFNAQVYRWLKANYKHPAWSR